MIQIRPARVEDAEAIAQFQCAMAAETEDKQLEPATVLAAVQAALGDASKGFYLVAEQGDQVVGSLLITDEWSDWRNSYLWYIQSVYIEPDHRGQGIFRQLYDEVYQLAVKKNVLFIRLYVETENHRAQKVYESLGMKRMPYYMYDVRVQ